MKSDPVNVSDPLLAVGRELEAFRAELEKDAEEKKRAFMRFRGETLRRVDEMCGRTIEAARLEEQSVESRIAEDRKAIDARIDGWLRRSSLALEESDALDRIAGEALHRLMPPGTGKISDRGGRDF
ncbi:MAG: hypothetical protein LBR61_13615 [Synergistaceae bacterium]|jgi:hypothetical protein|nr:hypothetical protein [Synergistaceae bacterium]